MLVYVEGRTKVKKVAILFLVIILTLAGCGQTASGDKGTDRRSSQSPSKQIIVSAAASLKEPLEDIEKLYEEQHQGLDLVFNFASSGSLQKQIEQGAPADIFLSAGQSQMDALEKQDLLVQGTRIDFTGNEIVLVVSRDNQNIKSFEDLTKANLISIGTPETVPAGKYAQETLKNMKLWDSLQDKIVQAKDVKQVLDYVKSGNVEAGIVYGSDAKSSDKIKVVAEAPAGSHSPIVYPGAVINTSSNLAEAKVFLDILCSSEAQAILENYSFKRVNY